MALAASQPVRVDDDFKPSIVDAPGSGSYPIASFTWLVVPAHVADDSKRTALTGLLKWMLGPGQAQAAALGYLSVPKNLASREETAIGKIH